MSPKRKKECDMKILRRIPIAIAVISAMVTVASCRTPASDLTIPASDLTILEATPHKLVLLVPRGSEPDINEQLQEVKRLGAEHCKKFSKRAGDHMFSLNVGSPSAVATITCVGEN